MPNKPKENFIDYSNETEELTIKSLMGIGYSAYEAEAYLSKLKIQRLSEIDNDCKNKDYNKELSMPPNRMKRFETKKRI